METKAKVIHIDYARRVARNKRQQVAVAQFFSQDRVKKAFVAIKLFLFLGLVAYVLDRCSVL